MVPPPTGYNALISRIKANLRMAINRLKLVQQKETAIAKQTRRDISQTLEAGKIASAQIRVEMIIGEDIRVELLELLELYCSLVLARVGMLERFDKDDRLKEALYILIYAGPHTNIAELETLRDLLSHVLPKEFILDAMDNTSSLVPEKVLNKIHTEVPSEELVNLYLQEIARAYNISVPGIYEAPVVENEKEETETADKASTPAAAGTTGAAAGKAPKEGAPEGAPPAADDLAARFAALKK